jgi:hypothetical protein
MDPVARTLEVLRLDAGHWMIVVTLAGDATARVEPFEAIEFELGQFWID